MTDSNDPERKDAGDSDELWTVDLHAHTSYSKDSLTPVASLLEAAHAAGLDRIAVTDHNTVKGALAAKALEPDFVIVGEEIKTTHGEIIGYYLSEEVPAGLSPQETLRRLRAQGAVITIPHPLDSLRSSAMRRANVMQVIDDVDALEVLNARCVIRSDNTAALELAMEHGKLMTAGSDAHSTAEVGRCRVELPPFENNAAGFRAALAQAKPIGRTSPFLRHFVSTYAKWRKRLFPTQPS